MTFRTRGRRRWSSEIYRLRLMVPSPRLIPFRDPKSFSNSTTHEQIKCRAGASINRQDFKRSVRCIRSLYVVAVLSSLGTMRRGHAGPRIHKEPSRFVTHTPKPRLPRRTFRDVRNAQSTSPFNYSELGHDDAYCR